MCRFIGVVAQDAAPVSTLLAEELGPFLSLACEHGDGWGLAFHATGEGDGGKEGSATAGADEVHMIKEPFRADASPNLGPVLDSCVTDAAVLHLRMASQNFPVISANTHPFGDRRAAFVHNGDFTPSNCLDGTIGTDLLATAKGRTDSERLFLAVRRCLDDGMDPVKALIQTAADVKSRAAGYASLNCALLTPSSLFVYAEHDPHSEVIGRRGPDFFDLCYRQDDFKVVVASTGWTQTEGWEPIPSGHVLEVPRGGGAVRIHG
ncbi:class II glutamine amidotransferase [Streptomyces sp. NPDC051644]|uniref:class II glutamine amidotransferase n=1 Tax=Streptomyces sp. NPDC051644 TaxID=3365666 RepID=UPI00379FCD86